MQNALTAIHPKTYPNGTQNRSRLALVRTDAGHWHEQLYRLKQFLETCDHLPPELQDVYFSLNGFGQYRRIDCLVQINCMFVDIDIYGLFENNLEFILSEIHKFIPDSLPKPGVICFSGRGLWLIWPIKPMPKQALFRWKRMQDYLVKTLQHLGADLKAKDVTRVIRVPYSYNSKSGNQVIYEVEPNFEPLDFHQIEKLYLPLLEKSKKPKTKEHSKPRTETQVHTKFFTPFSLNMTIIEDLKRLADQRKRNLVGHREYFLFIWRNCLAQLGVSEQESERQLRCVALQYLGSERLPDWEWSKSTLSAYKASFERLNGDLVQGYKLKSQWIIDALAITPDEQKQMQFLIGTAEKYERKNKRRSNQSREQYLEESNSRRELIREAKALDPNLTQRQLAELFNCSARTVYRALEK